MLGYEVDFGYMEAVTLMSSDKFSEKQIGYVSMGILLSEGHEMLPLIVQQLQNDLQSRNDNVASLALTAIANIGGREMAESLSRPVQNLLIATSTPAPIKKKSALCLLRLYRKQKDILTAEAFFEKIIWLLENESGEPLKSTHFGLYSGVISLMLDLQAEYSEQLEPALPLVVKLLYRIVIARDYTKDTLYYNVASPWLQIKLLRFLQRYPVSSNPEQVNSLNEILAKLLSGSENTKGHTNNHKNAMNSVLFEAINLIIYMDCNKDLLKQTILLLGRNISAKETNMRYLGFEGMAKVAQLSPETATQIKKHQETVILALKDPDISIRRRALNLLFGMCDKSSSRSIVHELLTYLTTADFDIREELVLKIAILAEKFAEDYSWYVDVILQLISLAGDFVSDEIWFRVVQIVTNKEDIQEYAAKTVFEALNHSSCHEATVKVGAYILGEFGNLIADTEGSRPMDLFFVLHSKFPTVTSSTKALLLSTYSKFLNLYPEEEELVSLITQVFRGHTVVLDPELQQRANEYLTLARNPELMQVVWDVMPPFPEKEQPVEEKNDQLQAGGIPMNSGPVQGIPPGGGYAPNVAAGPIAGGPMGGTSDPHGLKELLSQNPPFMKEYVKKLSLVNEGILYEDETIQIGFRAKYQQGKGFFVLYYGNKNQVPIVNITSNLVGASAALNVQAQNLPPHIDPGAQIQQAFQLNAVGPFDDYFGLQVAFVIGSQSNKAFTLRLPTFVHKFFEPTTLQGPDFFSNWKQFSGGALDSQVVLKAFNVDLNFIRNLLSTGFQMAVLQGVDPNPNNIVASANFVSVSGAPQLCLVRLEISQNANMIRSTVHAPHGALTASLQDALVDHLGTPAPAPGPGQPGQMGPGTPGQPGVGQLGPGTPGQPGGLVAGQPPRSPASPIGQPGFQSQGGYPQGNPGFASGPRPAGPLSPTPGGVPSGQLTPPNQLSPVMTGGVPSGVPGGPGMYPQGGAPFGQNPAGQPGYYGSQPQQFNSQGKFPGQQ